jgi:hypothetical protein
MKRMRYKSTRKNTTKIKKKCYTKVRRARGQRGGDGAIFAQMMAERKGPNGRKYKPDDELHLSSKTEGIRAAGAEEYIVIEEDAYMIKTYGHPMFYKKEHIVSIVEGGKEIPLLKYEGSLLNKDVYVEDVHIKPGENKGIPYLGTVVEFAYLCKNNEGRTRKYSQSYIDNLSSNSNNENENAKYGLGSNSNNE